MAPGPLHFQKQLPTPCIPKGGSRRKTQITYKVHRKSCHGGRRVSRLQEALDTQHKGDPSRLPSVTVQCVTAPVHLHNPSGWWWGHSFYLRKPIARYTPVVSIIEALTQDRIATIRMERNREPAAVSPHYPSQSASVVCIDSTLTSTISETTRKRIMYLASSGR